MAGSEGKSKSQNALGTQGCFVLCGEWSITPIFCLGMASTPRVSGLLPSDVVGLLVLISPSSQHAQWSGMMGEDVADRSSSPTTSGRHQRWGISLGLQALLNSSSHHPSAPAPLVPHPLPRPVDSGLFFGGGGVSRSFLFHMFHHTPLPI